MTVWLTRAGAHGEYEQRFIEEKKVYVTWDETNINLGDLPNRGALIKFWADLYPNAKPKALLNWASQVWPFAHEMHPGDLVVVPLKSQPAVYIGEITSDYHFEPTGPNPFFHW